MSYLVDSHAHLSGGQFDKDRDQVIQRAFEEGIAAILCPAEISEPQNLYITLDISNKYERIIAAGGVHPHLAKNFTHECLTTIEELVRSHQIHALGEIGLDFHYNFSPPETQKEVFHQQLQLAERLGFPVVLINFDILKH